MQAGFNSRPVQFSAIQAVTKFAARFLMRCGILSKKADFQEC